MNSVEQWVRQPQKLWIRRALFQVHLWTGIGVGLYVLLVSVSGSVLVYRPQLSRALIRRAPIVVASGERMTPDELKQAAQRAYPEYKVSQVLPRRTRTRPSRFGSSVARKQGNGCLIPIPARTWATR